MSSVRVVLGPCSVPTGGGQIEVVVGVRVGS